MMKFFANNKIPALMDGNSRDRIISGRGHKFSFFGLAGLS